MFARLLSLPEEALALSHLLLTLFAHYGTATEASLSGKSQLLIGVCVFRLSKVCQWGSVCYQRRVIDFVHYNCSYFRSTLITRCHISEKDNL